MALGLTELQTPKGHGQFERWDGGAGWESCTGNGAGWTGGWGVGGWEGWGRAADKSVRPTIGAPPWESALWG